MMLIVLLLVTIGLALFGPLLFKKEKHGPSKEGQQRGPLVSFAKGVVESEYDILLGSPVAGVVSKLKVAEGDTVKRGELLVTVDTAKIAAQTRKAEASLAEAQARLKERETGSRREDIAMAGSVVQSRTASYEQVRNEFARQQRLYGKAATTKNELDRAEEKMKVALAQLEEARQNELKQQSGSRVEEIAQAKAEVNRASAELTFSRAQLADHLIRAPRDGLILEKLKDVGETVDVGTAVLKLVDPSTLRIRGELEESDIGSVREGQAVEVTTDSYRDKVFVGTVSKVLPAVIKKSMKTFDPLASFDMNSQQIYIRLADYSGLKNGMTVTVKFKK